MTWASRSFICLLVTLMPVGYLPVSSSACTRSPVRVVVARMVSRITWWLSSGRPRQSMEIAENSRCSILFHLLAPSGRRTTVIWIPGSVASLASSAFQSRRRLQLDPPQSAVISSWRRPGRLARRQPATSGGWTPPRTPPSHGRSIDRTTRRRSLDALAAHWWIHLVHDARIRSRAGHHGDPLAMLGTGRADRGRGALGGGGPGGRAGGTDPAVPARFRGPGQPAWLGPQLLLGAAAVVAVAEGDRGRVGRGHLGRGAGRFLSAAYRAARQCRRAQLL